ncbi:MAG: GIY-YIG nuclease family protein [Clostridia bacterium]|nr:GIY-YIG nuclease family protein [Clostridia bacterium]
MKNYYTYMLRCKNGSIYTGITTDLNRRMTEHFSQSAATAKYTRSHEPKCLEAVWICSNRSKASKLEAAIKKLRKRQKEKLINKEISLISIGIFEPEEYMRINIEKSFSI